jgi:hypothetical protein
MGTSPWPPSKCFSRVNKLNEKIIYFYSLSVKYNKRSSAVSNDSQNGIHCCRRAVIIYELTKYIVKNNIIARLYFKLTILWSFSYSYADDIKLMTDKNAPPLLAISMAMPIRWYGAERIAQYGRSRATLGATGCCHWVSIHPVSPRWMPWSSILE